MSLAELWSAGPQKQQQFSMWVDRAGDRANADYGHPFKLDVPAYRVARRIFAPLAPPGRRGASGGAGAPSWHVEREAGAPRAVRALAWRYLRSANLAALRDRRALRIDMSRRTRAPQHPAAVAMRNAADVLPLPPVDSGTSVVRANGAGGADVGESMEEALGRRTRAFNLRTRERPGDAEAWLAFAAFQHEFLRLQARRALPAVLEKKAAILLRGLWEAAAARHAGDWRLWRAYLAHALADFAAFSVPAARAAHLAAARALAARRSAAAAAGGEAGLREVEEAMVMLLEMLMETERQARPPAMPARAEPDRPASLVMAYT
jgi:hypothetical protein